jgi:hypothetical protein
MKCSGLLAAICTQFLITVSVADELPHVCIVSQSKESDMVGERLVYNVKELIRKSRAMKLMPSERETGCLRLMINTTNLEGPTRNSMTSYSVIWVISFREHTGSQYVDSTLAICGSKRVLESAETIVANTEKLISSMTPPSQ